MFLCRGSIKDGLGHVTRSLAVAQELRLQADTLLVCIGDPFVERLLFNHPLDYKIVATQQAALELLRDYHPDIVVFDMLSIESGLFDIISREASTVSLSPVFNCLSQVDLLFHRTRYWADDWGGEHFKPVVRSGLEYAVVSNHCIQISSDVYRANLDYPYLSTAISMGGTDAANKTFRVLESIKDLPEKMVIWVMLGEGYAHSYQDLVDCVGNSNHEIILAKSNDSMWRILSTCSLAILSGGTTTYEAVYAGLPSINFLGNKQSQFLIQELVDDGVVLPAGWDFEEGLAISRQLIGEIYHDRDRLWTMHQKSRGLMDGLGAQRVAKGILEICPAS